MLHIKGDRVTNSAVIFIKLLTIQAKIPFLRQGSFKYFHFTEYKTKYFRDKVIPKLSFYRIQNQIGLHIMFRIKGQVQTSHLSNLQAYRPKTHFRDMGHSNSFILPNMKLNSFTYQVSHQGTSRVMVNLHIYQTCNRIS